MNIFFLSPYPVECARFHCDKHVVKMVLETAQLLCTAHHVLDGDKAMEGLYKKTHVNHPCAIWVRRSAANYYWTYILFIALCAEYNYRYRKTHKTDQKFSFKLAQFPKNLPPNMEILQTITTPPPQCMPDYCKVTSYNDVTEVDATVEAYRNYYLCEKDHLLSYTRRDEPEWMKEVS